MPIPITPHPATTALSRTIASFRFSEHSGLRRTFLEFLDTTVVANHDPALGNLIAFISNPITVQLLGHWSDHSVEAKDLQELGDFLATQKSGTSPKPITDAKSGRLQLRGELDRCYLLALILERQPSKSDDPDNWLFRLRVWLMVQAFIRNRRGIRLDENIRTVADGLRIGCDTDPQWLNFFLAFPKPPQGRPLSEFNFRLNASAHMLSRSEHLLPKEKSALNALIEISAGKDREIKSVAGLPSSLASATFVTIKQAAQPVVYDLDDGGESQLVASPSSETKFISTTPPPDCTPAERKLSARTVLFSTAESMQLLPWSWLRPNPQESDSLDAWINRELSSVHSANSRALPASLIWIANALGRSVARMLAIRISDIPDNEWVFDTETGVLRRLPPMRKPGWLPDPPATEWIAPVASEITILPPDTVRLALLQAARRAPAAKTLRELWPEGDASPPEKAILDCLQEVSTRLTRSMLAEALPQRAFNLHHDAVLARLIASHPQSALAGPHSYAQWSLETVTRLLSNPTTEYLTPHWRHTALGSRLALLEEPLRNAIASATRHVINAGKSGDPLLFHNAYSAYAVIALYAATGGRPLRSPFESVLHFDFDESLVFIDDKHGGPQQESGRVIPIPRALSAFIRNRYLPHLLALSALLRANAPELASEIFLSASSQPSGAIPFFFFLNAKSLDWYEVTPSKVFLMADIDWPLPANLFRHRLANRLRDQKVDPEIIDGVLGHGEWGNDTWSTNSFRSWSNDIASARPALESIFKSLRFRPIRGLQAAIQHLPVPIHATLPWAVRFGAAARQRERNRRFIAAIRDAKFVIGKFLGDRKLEDVDAKELDLLADQLARTADGMPSATGAIRLAYLQRLLEKAERRTGRRLRPRSERLFVREEPSLFTSDFRNAGEILNRICEALPEASMNGKAAQSLGVALLLCAESRVCDEKLLLEVAANRSRRVIRIEDSHFLEYGNVGEGSDTAGRRFRISSRCAFWHVQSETSLGIKAGDPIPPAFKAVAQILPDGPGNVGALLHSLASIVGQVNAMTLPGVVCGALSGDITTTALGWRDMARLVTGRRILLPNASDASTKADSDFSFKPPPSPEKASPDLEVATADLLKDIRAILLEDALKPPGEKNRRRTLLSELGHAIRKGAKAGVSQAILLLAQWIYAQAQPSGRKVLSITSLQRYLSALAWRFENELLSINLLEADGDELTEAYERVLLSSDKPAGTYELERLAAFHRWLASNFDIDSPDWHELPVVKAGIGISPGFIQPKEYLSALTAIQSDTRLSSYERDCAAMLLLLAYRFGLRRREVLGLHRRDWDDSGARIVVTVESNRIRKLKTASSRRQVPQVFAFQPIEQTLVIRILTKYCADHGPDHDKLLLVPDESHKLASAVLNALKNVTGNRAITIHHARHSAANLVAIHALGLRIPGWTSTPLENEVSPCLLGACSSASRRHAWAVARFLGHASPHTTCRSYLHFLFDWADQIIGISPDVNSSMSAALRAIPSLDALPALPGHAVARKRTRPRTADFPAILEVFRLYGRGVRTASIAEGLGLRHADVERCVRLLENPEFTESPVDANAQQNPDEEGRDDGTDIPNGDESTKGPERWTAIGDIVRTMNDSAWNRMIDWAKSHPLRSEKPTPVMKVEDFMQMVGRTKQLLAWRQEHFRLLRFALGQLEIEDRRYQLFGSAQVHHGTIDLARKEGFLVSPRPNLKMREDSKRSSLLQVDSAHVGPYNEPVLSRIALVFRESDESTIRNRNQLVLMLTAVALTVSAKKSRG